MARIHQKPYGGSSPISKIRKPQKSSPPKKAPLHSPSYDVSRDRRQWDSFELVECKYECKEDMKSAAKEEYGPKVANTRFNQLVLHSSSVAPGDMAWITGKFYEGSHRLEKIEIYDF